MANGTGGYPAPTATSTPQPTSGARQTRVVKGKSRKGVTGEWHIRPNGQKVFVAKPSPPRSATGADNNSNSSTKTGGSTGAQLPVARFRTWSPEHQRQALKFYGGDAMTTADFYALPPAQQRDIMERVRQGRAAAVKPDSATRTQTVNDINIAAEQAAGLKYGQTERQIGVDEKASDIQQGNISQWFQQYQDILKQSAADNKAAYQAAQTAVASDTASSEAAAAAQQGGVQQAAAADAAARGAKVDPALASQAAQAAASRVSSANAIKGTVAAQGATSAAYSGNLRGVAANQGVQAHLGEAATKKNLKQKLRDLLTEKGQYEQTTRQDLIGAERKNALENAAFNLDVVSESDKAAAADANAATKTPSAKAAAASATTTATEEAKNAAKLGMSVHQYRLLGPHERQRRLKDLAKTKRGSAADTRYTTGPFAGMLKSDVTKLSDADAKAKVDAYNAGKGKGKGKGKGSKPTTGPGSISSAAENKAVTQVNQLLTLMQNPPRWPGGPLKGQPMTPDAVAHHYAATGTDGRIIHVAVSLFRNKGKLGPDGVKNAHDLGIHVGGRWKRVSGRGPTPVSTPPQTAGPNGQNRPN
jgi:hypothetical protein